MIKTLICSLPPLDSERPPLAGAIIANICRQQGHEVVTVDFQYELTKFLTRKNLDKNYFSDVFYESQPSFNQAQLEVLEEFIDTILVDLKVEQFDYISSSLFSYLAQQFGNVFFKKLRPLTSAKIIIGGAGLVNFKNSIGQLGDINALTFAENLKHLKLIDEYITGEAELALPLYFTVGHGPGIGNNNFKQIDELDVVPWPDYSYYNLNNYQRNDCQTELTIIGSRGCVRHCTFCDVAKTSPKYRYRSGDNIAAEIIHHYETHGVTNFYFADSLVNGSFKAFNDMCNGLAKYQFDKPISWSGQYIIRSRATTPKDHFKLLKESGCSTLFVGIESGSDRVRFELGKKFTNDDIEYYLENFSAYGIKTLFLMFTGYVTETEQDHADALAMFNRWQKYVATGTILGIETLNLLSILPGAPLEEIAKKGNFMFLQDDNGSTNLRSWVNPALPKFDFKERVRRHITMIEEAMRYKWPLWNGQLSMNLYEDALKKFIKTPKRYISVAVI